MSASANTDLQTLLSLTKSILAAVRELSLSNFSWAHGVDRNAISTKILETSIWSGCASCTGEEAISALILRPHTFECFC